MKSKEGESIRLVYNGRELMLPKDPADKGGLSGHIPLGSFAVETAIKA